MWGPITPALRPSILQGPLSTRRLAQPSLRHQKRRESAASFAGPFWEQLWGWEPHFGLDFLKRRKKEVEGRKALVDPLPIPEPSSPSAQQPRVPDIGCSGLAPFSDKQH
jgi:hypothetical protein